MREVERALFILAVVAALGATSGCENKAPRCKAVIATMDDSAAALKGVTTDGRDFGVMAKNLRTAADLVARVADIAAQRDRATDPALAIESGAYQTVAREIATALRRHADLITPLAETADGLPLLMQNCLESIYKLKSACSIACGEMMPVKSDACDDCQAILAVLKGGPDNDDFGFAVRLKGNPPVFGKCVVGLKALRPTDLALDAELGMLVSRLGQFEEAVARIFTALPAVDASGDALQVVLAKEAAIARRLKETCSSR